MPDYALILHPSDPFCTFTTADLLAILKKLELIGAELSPNWYALGASFFEQITLLGCSPIINCAVSQSDEQRDFWRVHLPTPLAHPIWRVQNNAPAARCPKCRTPDPQWKNAIPQWELNPSARHFCPNCQSSTPLHQWKLREAAGFGRNFIEFWGIYPHEAVPGDNFLTVLAQSTRTQWQWFFDILI